LNVFAKGIVGAVALLLSANAAIAADNAIVTVAGKKIIIPAPAGMRSVDVSAVPPATSNVSSCVIGPRVLAVFIPVAAKVADLPTAYAYVQCDDPPMNVSRRYRETERSLRKNAAAGNSSSISAINERLARERGKSRRRLGCPGCAGASERDVAG
jgi:hypothetical protein